MLNSAIHNQIELTVLCSIYKENLDVVMKTLESIINQTFTNFKIVIIDDYPERQDRNHFLKSVASADPRITIIKNSRNLGLTDSLIRGHERSQSPLIARIDIGDLWLEDKLKLQVNLFQRDPKLVIVGTQCLFVNETTGLAVGKSSFPTSDKEIRLNLTKRRGVFVHPSIVFRREISYRSFFKYSQDLDLYLRAQDYGKLYCMPEYLTICIIAQNGITVSRKHIQRKYINAAYSAYSSGGTTPKPETISVTCYDSFAWRIASVFFSKYITTKSNHRTSFIPPIYLMLTCLLYPPLAKDYIYRLFLSAKRN